MCNIAIRLSGFPKHAKGEVRCSLACVEKIKMITTNKEEEEREERQKNGRRKREE